MGRVSRTALAALATSALLLSTVPALPAIADPAEPTIIDVASTPVNGFSIDGNSLFIQDRESGSITEHTLSFATGTATESLLGQGGWFIAGEGQVAWNDYREWALNSRDENGIVTSVYSDTSFLTSITKGWILERGAYLRNLATGSSEFLSYEGTLLDGVVYRPANSWPTAGPLVSRDLTTGATDVVPVPATCTYVSGVQAAGSWLLLECGNATWIVDRTGGVAPFTVKISDRDALLGNGFLTVLDGERLTWSPLSGGALTMSTLSTTAQRNVVSRGSDPTVAWIDRAGITHAALLPITGTTLPAHPTGPSSPPASPVITATHTDTTVTLRWPSAPAGEKVTGYFLTGFGGLGSVRLPATATSHTFGNARPGVESEFAVTAYNSAGPSVERRIKETPLYPYLGYGGISSADYVEDTGVLTVSWSYTPFPKYELVESFDVSIGGQSVTGIGADARSVSLSVPGAVRGDVVTLTARGNGLTSTWTRPIESDQDSTLPTASIEDLAPVTLGKTFTATVTAADNRAVAGIDVRLRFSAGPGAGLGAWTYPAAWQGSTTRTLSSAAKPGATYCLSTRARDAKRNVSAWSPQVCTAIALDETALKKAGRWTQYRSPNYFGGSVLRINSPTAYLSTPARSSKLYVVATTCPTCGQIGVRYGNIITWLVDLRSAYTAHQQVIPVDGGMTFSGTVKIVRWKNTIGSVDGFAVLGR